MFFLEKIRKSFEKNRIGNERRRFFELSIDPMCIVGFDGYFKAVNSAWTGTLGWEENEFFNKHWMEFVHPDDIENSKDVANRLINGEKVTVIENKYICKDGNYRWLSWKAIPRPDEKLIYAIAHDITGDKEIRELNKINEDRLNSLLMLSKMTDVSDEKIRDFALESVVRITRSSAGYLHFVNEDDTIELVSYSEEVLKHCTTEKVRHYPIEDAGVWADSVRLKRPVIHNDYQNMPDKKGYPDGHFPLYRHMSVPVFDKERIVAVAGVGNKEEPYDEFDVNQFDLFMYNMWGILKQRRAEEVLKRFSMEDALTGLANRRMFDQVLDSEWRRALREKKPLSVIIFDIDNFKKYNDLYGHQMGDECLRRLATCLRGNIRRAGDLIARYGGEEFIAVLPGANAEDAFSITDSMRKCVMELKLPHANSLDLGIVTISAGLASVIPDKKIDPSELVRMADNALYTAKSKGRNTVYMYKAQVDTSGVVGTKKQG